MKTFIKCEMCNAKIPADRCVFATHKRVIGGKEYIFCCVRCAEAFEKTKSNKTLSGNLTTVESNLKYTH